MRHLALAAIAVLGQAVHATTWNDSATVQDPISGEECTVSEPASWGTYIYEWPSKYDGVYWPHTSVKWIWFCPQSGYTSFGDDFEEISPEEVLRVAQFLEDVYDPSREATSELKLYLLESIYRLRSTQEGFWSWFHRVKANLLESIASQSRFDAIPLLEKQVATLEPSFELVQLTFVLGDYYRIAGRADDARELFDRARGIAWEDENGDQQHGSAYISKLIDKRVALMEEQ